MIRERQYLKHNLVFLINCATFDSMYHFLCTFSFVSDLVLKYELYIRNDITMLQYYMSQRKYEKVLFFEFPTLKNKKKAKLDLTTIFLRIEFYF